MTVTTVQIYDFNVILSKGNNSKIGDDWDKKKIRITYFFMRNQNMKFQNISIHGIHAITSVGQSVRSEKNLSEISKNSVRFFLGAVFCHTK